DAINNSGVIVGSDADRHAFAWIPESGSLLNLNPVFGWTAGEATSINDRGDIIGNGDIPIEDTRFAGLPQVTFSTINNSGQISGTFVAPGGVTTGFLYTPGQPLATFPNATPYQ